MGKDCCGGSEEASAHFSEIKTPFSLGLHHTLWLYKQNISSKHLRENSAWKSHSSVLHGGGYDLFKLLRASLSLALVISFLFKELAVCFKTNLNIFIFARLRPCRVTSKLSEVKSHPVAYSFHTGIIWEIQACEMRDL